MEAQNTSQLIRNYGNKHGVFGADEIRRIYGQKAALLCTRLSAKGQFRRIKNGVYSMLDCERAEASAYQDYLERIKANRLSASESEDASIIDQLIAWMKRDGDVSVREASDHFKRDMKGMFATYHKRGQFKRTGPGRYSYAGEVPAPRREARPSAVPTGDEEDAIKKELAENPRMTIRQLGELTGYAAVRLKDILEHLVHKGKVARHDPISKAAHATYSLPKKASYSSLSDEMLTVLAMAGSHGSMSARRLATHKVSKNEEIVLTTLEAYGLLERGANDDEMGGTTFQITSAGIRELDKRAWRWRDLPAIAHRPLHKKMLELAAQPNGTGYKEIMTKAGVARDPIDRALKQLIDAGLLKRHGKPCVINLK